MLKERFVALVNAWSEDAEDIDVLEMIEENMLKLEAYVKHVYEMEVSLQVIKFRYEGEEYRYRVETLDKARRNAHERAIVAVNQLNRWASLKGVEPMFTGDSTDRYQVADFCGEIVNELFKDRTGNEVLKELIKY